MLLILARGVKLQAECVLDHFAEAVWSKNTRASSVAKAFVVWILLFSTRLRRQVEKEADQWIMFPLCCIVVKETEKWRMSFSSTGAVFPLLSTGRWALRRLNYVFAVAGGSPAVGGAPPA